MSDYYIEIDKANEKLSVTTDDYEAFKTTLGLVKSDRASYTTTQETLLNQLLEEQNRLCECRTELKKAKGYLSELLKCMPYVHSCDSCEYLDKAEYCQRSIAKSDRKCHRHKLQTEIEAFLEGEKKDECGNV